MALETLVREDARKLLNELNFAEKVQRALWLIGEAHQRYGNRLVVANSLGKDSCVVWDLVKRVSPDIRGFIVTTRFKPVETKEFMHQVVARYPELEVVENDEPIPKNLYKTDPGRCCEVLKAQPIRQAVEEMDAGCWVTGLRLTEGSDETVHAEVEQRDAGLIKLNPILIWHEREIWQYLCVHGVPVNPLYMEGYRSLGCARCLRTTRGAGGRCGIHLRSLKASLDAPPLPQQGEP